jgi:chromosome segregation ATPase
LSDSPELLKPNPEVTDSKLQIELGNLRAENESLRQRFTESQDTIETLNRGIEALNEQLATANQAITEREDSIESLRQEFKDKLEAAKAKNQRLKNDSGNSQAEVAKQRSQLETERADRIMKLKAQGWGKAKIILDIWGVTKGGSSKYKAAETEYQRLVEEGG